MAEPADEWIVPGGRTAQASPPLDTAPAAPPSSVPQAPRDEWLRPSGGGAGVPTDVFQATGPRKGTTQQISGGMRPFGQQMGELAQGQQDYDMALAQGVSPWASDPDFPGRPRRLGPVMNFEWGEGYRGPKGEELFINPQTDFVARDPQTGELAVFARNPQTNEGGITTAARAVQQGWLTGPVAGVQRTTATARLPTVASETAGNLAIQRASEAARDAQAFDNMDVRRFGPAFNQGPLASVAKQLTETPIIGAPLRSALDESLAGAAAAGQRIATEMAPMASAEQTGLAVQRGLDRYRTAGLADIEPGILEDMGIAARAPMQARSAMSAGAAERAAQAERLREATGEVPTAFTSRGVTVPAARSLEETITARRAAGDMSDAELGALIRAPSADTSFASRLEALYESAWRRIPQLFKSNDTANPNLIRAVNTDNTFRAISDFERRAAISGGIADGRFADMAQRVRTNTTLENLRAMRTEIGRSLSNFGLYDTTLDRTQLKQIYGSLSRDIEIAIQDLANRARIQASRASDPGLLRTANEANRALYELRRADRYMRLGLERMDNFAKLVGTDNPQHAAGILIRSALDGTKGNVRMLRTALAALRPEERNQLSALVLQELGKPVGSARGTAQELGFSVSSALTRWNNMAPEARNLLFGGDHARAIADYMRVVSRLANVEALANTSRSGTNFINLSGLLGTGAMAGSSALTGNFMASLATVLGAAGTGLTAAALLARPAYTRWAVEYAKLRAQILNAPSQVSGARLVAHINRLGELARHDQLLLPAYRAIAEENGIQQRGGEQQPVKQDRPRQN